MDFSLCYAKTLLLFFFFAVVLLGIPEMKAFDKRNRKRLLRLNKVIYLFPQFIEHLLRNRRKKKSF